MSPLPVGKRVGYVPYRADHSAPGDRRRFAFWAERRGVRLEHARPGVPYDLVVLSERADISVWARQPPGGPRLVYDLIDSYLTIPAGSPSDLARGFGKSLLRQHRRITPSFTRSVMAMCRRADAVVCSTPEQRSVLLEYCDDVRVILDDHEHEIQPLVRNVRAPAEPLRLLWEGQPQNLRGMKPAFLPALRALAPDLAIELHVVSDPTYPRWFGRLGSVDTQRHLDQVPVPLVLHDWTAERLALVAATCDVGVIPLDLDDALAAAKPENKLLIMWRLGLPAVASATPAYQRVMSAAGVDLTCRSERDWTAALRHLSLEGIARSDVAAAGMRYVAQHHTSAVVLDAWDALVDDLLARPRRGRPSRGIHG